ncbi:MAG: HupE/UreJ family protein [Patescibacteria group bacterium]
MTKPSIRLLLLALLLFGVQTTSALAHPADITVTDFFVERDWDNVEIAPERLRAVHSVNWFEAMEILDPNNEMTAAELLADLRQSELAIASYLDENLSIQTSEETCSYENISIPEQAAVEVTAVGLFFDFDVVCPVPIGDMTVTASFLLEKYPGQSNFLTFYRFPGDLIVTDSVNQEQPTVTHTIADPQAAQSSLSLFTNFVYEGIRHIVPLGLDHILFIATVFLIAGSLRRIVLYSLIFTLAHSITLALTVLGFIVPNGSLIEAIIALSILVFAVDAVYRFVPQLWQGAIIFAFGLFHGMGFASVLTELGLPEGAEVLALIGFNIGVEVGQLGVILVLAASTWWIFSDPERRRLTTITMATAIACVAAYWVIERTLL